MFIEMHEKIWYDALERRNIKVRMHVRKFELDFVIASMDTIKL